MNSSKQYTSDDSESKASKGIMGDLDYNALLYQTPENLSLRVYKTQRQLKADRTQYNQLETCTIRFNTGSDYIDPYNSYLSLTLSMSEGTGSFGIGSILNIINQVVIRSKSGIELDRFRRINLYKAQSIKYEHSRSWMVKEGTLLGYAEGTESATNPSATGVGVTATKYLIPLCELCGFFAPVGTGRLVPAALASGLEIELTFESAARAFVGFNAPALPLTYTVDDPQVHVDAVRLTDATQRVLNMKAAKEGLSYMYYRYHTSEVPANMSNITHRVSLAVAQAVSAMAVIVNNTASNATDNNASINFDVTDWYYRIGQNYSPATTLTDDAAGRESYFQALKTFGILSNQHENGSVSQTDFIGRYGGLTMTFAKDDAMLMSGESVNNSRQLELLMNRSGSNTTDQQVLWVKYLAQAKTYLDSVIVAV